jgi:hypothetical protein
MKAFPREKIYSKKIARLTELSRHILFWEHPAAHFSGVIFFGNVPGGPDARSDNSGRALIHCGNC